ncbi:MAG: hypothetical protein VW378_04100 [bacterium]
MILSEGLGLRYGDENEADIFNEDADNVFRFSPALKIKLFERLHQQDKLVVPYSIIKVCKKCRSLGIREFQLTFHERADRYSSVNSLLDLWGFDSFGDYLYSVAELGFLEGLIPSLQASFLTPHEFKHLSEIISVFKINYTFDSDASFLGTSQFEKELTMRQKNLEWALKLGLCVSTGFYLHKKLPLSFYKKKIDSLCDLFETYGFINEFVLSFDSNDYNKRATLNSLFQDVLAYAKDSFPSDVGITVPYNKDVNLDDMKRLGVFDLGTIFCHEMIFSDVKDLGFDLSLLNDQAENLGFTTIKRFSLRKEFIREERYSKKLGQIFDAYRYRLKKERERFSKNKHK